MSKNKVTIDKMTYDLALMGLVQILYQTPFADLIDETFPDTIKEINQLSSTIDDSKVPQFNTQIAMEFALNRYIEVLKQYQ